MITGLLFRDQNAQWNSKPDGDREVRHSDLKLGSILQAMSGGDPVIFQSARQLLDQPLRSWEEIRYRQEILKECLQMPERIAELYEICLQAEKKRKNTWCRLTSPHLTTVYSSAADLLKIYMEALVEIMKTMKSCLFHSSGLDALSRRLQQELTDAYLEEVRSLESGIGDREGILISAGFGPYLQGVDYIKRQPESGFSRLRWLLQPSYTLADRDMNGAKDLEVRKDRAINEVANAMAQAAGSLQAFVDQLGKELAFYLGCIHLYQRLTELQLPMCFPQESEDRFYQGLYDGGLALQTGTRVTGSTLEAHQKEMWLITGANQGGKTTFLRSVGICQLMAQCGMFVCCEACRIPLRRQIFTHFCREEDRHLNSGKLDEELGRMSAIVEKIRPGAMLLSNESFSSTNDRDGSELFQGITRALLEKKIEVFAVTHLIGYALSMADREDVISLRPERKENGVRTFRILEGKPSPEAYAEDIYRRIFSGENPEESEA